MSASENFNTVSSKAPANYVLEFMGDHVVRGAMRDNGGWTSHVVTMDFLNRIVTVLPSGDTKGGQVFTFGQYDTGAVEWHYHQLKNAGRNPREPDGLSDKPVLAAKSGGLSL